MKQPFSQYTQGTNAPALGSDVITPSDTEDLATAIRCVTIAGAGTLRWMSIDGTVNDTATLPAGGSYPMSARRILATGTTATGITGWI